MLGTSLDVRRFDTMVHAGPMDYRGIVHEIPNEDVDFNTTIFHTVTDPNLIERLKKRFGQRPLWPDSIIHKACQEHGFVHVTHFGFSQAFGERLFQASKDLFDHPTKEQDYAPWHPSHNTGYSPFRTERLNINRPADLKEAFNVRFPPTRRADASD